MRIFAVLSICLLTACGTQPIQITSRPLQIDIARASDPAGVQMLPVNFRVITRENLDSVIAEIEQAQTGTLVLVGATMADYENLTLNLADLRRYIEQQQAIIGYYRTLTQPVSPAPATPSSTN